MKYLKMSLMIMVILLLAVNTNLQAKVSYLNPDNVPQDPPEGMVWVQFSFDFSRAMTDPTYRGQTSSDFQDNFLEGYFLDSIYLSGRRTFIEEGDPSEIQMCYNTPKDQWLEMTETEPGVYEVIVALAKGETYSFQYMVIAQGTDQEVYTPDPDMAGLKTDEYGNMRFRVPY